MGDLRQKAELVIRINGEDHILPLQDAVSKRMDQIAGKTRETGAATDSWGQSLLTARERVAVFAAGINGVLGIARQVAAAAGAIFDSLDAVAREQQIDAAFQRAASAAGWTADAAERMREAVHGTVEGDRLSKIGSQAIRAGVSLEQLTTLLDVARGAARTTGEDVAATAEKIVQAVSKGSARALADVLPGVADGLAEVGDGLEGAAKREEVLNLLLEQGVTHFGNLADSAADAADRMKVAADDVQDSFWGAFLGDDLAGRLKTASDREEQSLRRRETILAEAKRIDAAAQTAAGLPIVETREYGEAQLALAEASLEARKSEQSRTDAIRDSIKAQQMATAEKAGALMEEARLAREMGATTIATEKLAEAQRLMGYEVHKATLPLQDQLAAMVAQREEAIANAVALGAMAAAQGRAAIAAEQFGRAATLLGVRPKRRGGGGARKREEEMGPPREAFELQERQMAEERDFALRNLEFHKRMDEEMVQARVAAMDSLASSLEEATARSLEAGAMFAEAFGGAGESVRNASQIIVSELSRVNALLTESVQATGGTAEGWKKAAPGMLAASGKMTAGLIKDVQLQAAIMAIFEAAAAAASYPDVVGMASHGLASVLYAAVAGGAGGGGASAGAGGGVTGSGVSTMMRSSV